jgi:hypothetical protein
MRKTYTLSSSCNIGYSVIQKIVTIVIERCLITCTILFTGCAVIFDSTDYIYFIKFISRYYFITIFKNNTLVQINNTSRLNIKINILLSKNNEDG